MLGLSLSESIDAIAVSNCVIGFLGHRTFVIGMVLLSFNNRAFGPSHTHT